MASADDVKKITGYTIGGVSPVGHLNKIDIFIDNSLERFNSFCSSRTSKLCFKINFKDLQKITNGKIKEITE
jgi:prolyl-tRNA editing enzyme YbaK/EbsC (Cys-tRNA(Pro) deacylase)